MCNFRMRVRVRWIPGSYLISTYSMVLVLQQSREIKVVKIWLKVIVTKGGLRMISLNEVSK